MNSRNSNFMIVDNSRYKVGQNKATIRMKCVNNPRRTLHFSLFTVDWYLPLFFICLINEKPSQSINIKSMLKTKEFASTVSFGNRETCKELARIYFSGDPILKSTGQLCILFINSFFSNVGTLPNPFYTHFRTQSQNILPRYC